MVFAVMPTPYIGIGLSGHFCRTSGRPQGYPRAPTGAPLRRSRLGPCGAYRPPKFQRTALNEAVEFCTEGIAGCLSHSYPHIHWFMLDKSSRKDRQDSSKSAQDVNE